MSITLRPLLRPTLGRSAGAICGAVAAGVAGLLADVLSVDTRVNPPMTQVPFVPFGMTAVVLAIGIGWLLGPLAARRDRWAAAGAAISAAFLGVVVGSYVVLAWWALTSASSDGTPLSIPAALLWSAVMWPFALVFVAGPAFVPALPVTVLWVLLVQAVTRLIDRTPDAAGISEPAVQTPRTRLPRKPFGRRRLGAAS